MHNLASCSIKALERPQCSKHGQDVDYCLVTSTVEMSGLFFRVLENNIGNVRSIIPGA